MSETLQHDPRTKQQIKKALYEFLYHPVVNSFKARLDDLIQRNTIIGRYTHRSFVYKGVLYTHSAETGSPPLRSNRVVPSLVDDVLQYTKDIQLINDQEIPYVIGYINQVLNSSNHLCDYYRMLPESVHAPIRKLIATCPCRSQSISPELVNSIQEKNQSAIALLKERMVVNLLI